jgi:hypothetical protein
MTAFAVQAPGHGGAVITLTAPTTGSVDTVPTGAGIGLWVVGPSSASATVAIPIPAVDATQAVTPRSVTIATATSQLIPLPSTVYGTGPITLTWSGTLTACVVAVITIP